MAKILLADDEECLRMMMGRQLRRSGHQVTLAEDGQIALEFLRQETFDVVVSDMKMPRLDGMQLLERAREIAPDTEFIILTGHGNMENAIEAFKRGNVFDYLLKPLDDIHELSTVVGRAAERRFLRSENIRLVSELETHIAELEKAQQELKFNAEHDGLTGLLNHRTIHARLHEMMEARASASKEESQEENLEKVEAQPPLSVMMLDMDKFKLLNDTYGHPVGDEALRHIGRALMHVCGPEDLAGRCGGDEFMIVLPGKTAEQARTVAETIQEFMRANPFVTPDVQCIPMPLCFGISDIELAGASAAGLVAASDAALYSGKQSGGNAVKLHLVCSEEDVKRNSAYDVLDGLVSAIDNKDRYTRRHSEDMTNYALLLTQALCFSEETCNVVRVAGLLHDVGKIGIPDKILSKPGKLTADEYEVMKTHVTISGLIIHGLPHLTDILDAVANHHERWDGQGYPRGLAGEQIPLLGRIMAIADAFSAMTLDRPYRSGLSVETALAEIEKHAGSQFDPHLAHLFVKRMHEEAENRCSQLRKAA